MLLSEDSSDGVPGPASAVEPVPIRLGEWRERAARLVRELSKVDGQLVQYGPSARLWHTSSWWRNAAASNCNDARLRKLEWANEMRELSN